MEGGFLIRNADRIIMGTFPPPRIKLKTQGNDYFFYPNNRNQFWNIIDEANAQLNLETKRLKFTNKSAESFKENILRKANFCYLQNWAFLDFFSKVERKVENSSRDIDLIEEENVFSNVTLLKYLDFNIKIEKIVCTFKTAYINLKKNIEESENFKIETLNDNEIIWFYNNRKISIILIPPPTRSNMKLVEKVQHYKKHLYN